MMLIFFSLQDFTPRRENRSYNIEGTSPQTPGWGIVREPPIVFCKTGGAARQIPVKEPPSSRLAFY